MRQSVSNLYNFLTVLIDTEYAGFGGSGIDKNISTLK
jgi:hypothetical protein